jgi:hypothetical protein
MAGASWTTAAGAIAVARHTGVAPWLLRSSADRETHDLKVRGAPEGHGSRDRGADGGAPEGDDDRVESVIASRMRR